MLRTPDYARLRLVPSPGLEVSLAGRLERKGRCCPGWSHVVPHLGLSVSGGPSAWIEEWLRLRDGRAEMRGDAPVLMGVFSPLHLERKSVHGGGGGGRGVCLTTVSPVYWTASATNHC